MASVKEENSNQEEDKNDVVERHVEVEAGEEEVDRDREGGIEKDEENKRRKEEQEKGNVKEEEGGDGVGRGKEMVKAGKKGTRKVKRGNEKSELSSARTPGIERPSRERKTVERFTVNATARGNPVARSMAIDKGRGIRLKDIPNVAFKLSKRKGDENMQLLHTILFGKKAKVLTLKKRISLFSGFVWVEDEEKQRTKVKEKLDKCVKEKLLDFCDVLNIPVNKATVKKEELSLKLLEFLESPHATTDTLLADKDKNKKRKSKDSASKTSSYATVASGRSSKKPKLDSGSGKKRKQSAEEEVNDKSESSQTEDDQDDGTTAGAKSDQEEINSENEIEEGIDKPERSKVINKCSIKESARKDTGSKTGGKSKFVRKGTSANASSTPDKSTKKPSSSKSKKGVAEAESESKQKSKKKRFGKKSDGTNTPVKDKSSSKKNSTKSSSKVVEKDKGKGKYRKSAKKEPSREELHAVVEDILKEVDFNTVTLSDILKLLGKHFGIDLIHRKLEVKEIITEVINNMSDDEDEEATKSGDGDGKDAEDDEA